MRAGFFRATAYAQLMPQRYAPVYRSIVLYNTPARLGFPGHLMLRTNLWPDASHCAPRPSFRLRRASQRGTCTFSAPRQSHTPVTLSHARRPPLPPRPLPHSPPPRFPPPRSPTPRAPTPTPRHRRTSRRKISAAPGWRAPRTRRPSPRRWQGCPEERAS